MRFRTVCVNTKGRVTPATVRDGSSHGVAWQHWTHCRNAASSHIGSTNALPVSRATCEWNADPGRIRKSCSIRSLRPPVHPAKTYPANVRSITPQLPLCATMDVDERAAYLRAEGSKMGDLLQPTHLIILAVVAFLLFGARRLPELGKGLGEGLRGFREGIKGVTDPPPTTTQQNTQAPPPVPPANTPEPPRQA
jgi:sec-independent protein translocase protein TatA